MEDYQALSYQFREIKNTLTTILNKVLHHYQISPVMMFTLELLLKKPDAIAVDIAEEVGITRGAVTQLLDKLEDQGLLARLPHPTSRRSLRIHVTEEGHALTQSILKTYHEEIGKLFREYSADELASLRHLLSKLPL